MQSVLLLGAVQSVFLSILLLTKKQKVIADFILVSLLVFTALPLFLYYFIYDEISALVVTSQTMPSFMYFVNVPFIMTFTPSVYLYVKSVLKPEKNFFLKNLIHYSPIFIFIILTIFLIDFSEIKEEDFNFFKISNYKIFLIFTPITLGLSIAYIFFSFKLFSKFNKKIRQNYSYTDDIDLNWLKLVLITVSSAWILLFITAIIVKQITGGVFIVYKIVFFTLTFVVFLIAFFGFKQANVFVNNSDNLNFDSKRNLKPEPNVTDEEVKKLLEFMKNKKPYLENKLSLKGLADLLDWQPHYLSKIINEQLNQNFFEFVNKYRVEEFKIQLQENKNYKIISVAFDSGFNSKSSFNRIFKDITGLTPSEYKNSIELTTNNN